MEYYHVDVFAEKPFSGNGFTVFIDVKEFEKSYMQTVTQEMRQFESIFLHQTEGNTYRANIFTMEEELDFAGHPIIGAAAILHDLYSNGKPHDYWTIQLNRKAVNVETTQHDHFYTAQMNQGKASFLNILSQEQEDEFLNYFNLSREDAIPGLPFEVISTGLPYLIIPIRTEALSKVKVTIDNLEEKLNTLGAKFFFVFAPDVMQGRTWDNLGKVEDIATGSAAGPIGAFMVKHNLARMNSEIHLKQGDFVGRPSKLQVIVKDNGEILVKGNVYKIAVGQLLDELS